MARIRVDRPDFGLNRRSAGLTGRSASWHFRYKFIAFRPGSPGLQAAGRDPATAGPDHAGGGGVALRIGPSRSPRPPLRGIHVFPPSAARDRSRPCCPHRSVVRCAGAGVCGDRALAAACLGSRGGDRPRCAVGAPDRTQPAARRTRSRRARRGERGRQRGGAPRLAAHPLEVAHGGARSLGHRRRRLHLSQPAPRAARRAVPLGPQAGCTRPRLAAGRGPRRCGP